MTRSCLVLLGVLLISGCEDQSVIISTISGQKVAKGTFRQVGSEKWGDWVIWNKDGVVMAQGTYRGAPYPDDLPDYPDSVPREGREERWFFYTPQGELDFEGRYQGGEEEGTFIWYFPDGRRKQEGFFQKGLRQGDWKAWYQQGQLRWEGKFVDGLESGLCQSYHPNGVLASSGNFKEGKEDGPWIFYHPGGRLKAQGKYDQGQKIGLWSFFNEFGNITEQGGYKLGKKDGEWVIFAGKDEFFQGSYNQGRKEGAWTKWVGQTEVGKQIYRDDEPLFAELQDLVWWDENQERIRQRNGYYLFGSWVDHGTMTEWFPGSIPSRELHYHHGILEGRCRVYYSDGSLMLEGTYQDGKMDGVWRLLDDIGKDIKSARYRKGSLVSGRSFDDQKTWFSVTPEAP